MSRGVRDDIEKFRAREQSRAVIIHEQAYQLEALRSDMQNAMADAWDEGAEAQAKCYGMDKDTGANPYRIAP